MQQAVAEARRRWPEFVGAFESRSTDQMFGVKAKFTQGENSEFMWLSVKAVENGVIFGVLDNNPVDLTKPKLGDRVRVNVADLNDWVITTTSGSQPEMIGGFTIKVVDAAQRRATEAGTKRKKS
jgi:uncharacterized protein YegJ (DUF2314 family)